MSRSFSFGVEARDGTTLARVGSFSTPHGVVRTPAFMPVGTRACVKGVQARELAPLGTQMLLANAYHLHLRPGEEVVRELGGLHRFMDWSGPLLTDSGGYQVFSLGHLTSIDDDGATMRSVVDGKSVRLEPGIVMEIERALGADVIMAFDHCPADPLERPAVEAATARTHRWLERCVRAWRSAGGVESGQALFGIVQGGAFADLRARSVEEVTSHDLPGYALGGVSVGEERAHVLTAIDASVPHLPVDRPRYLMGVGTPRDFLDAIERGIDLFDCVTPTRHGRNHQAFTRAGRLNLRNLRFRTDESAIESDCDCPCCTRVSRAYLRHLALAGEMLGGILITLHNLRFFHRLMEDVREAIPRSRLAGVRERYASAD